MANQQRSDVDSIFLKAEQFRASGKTNEALQEYSKVVYFHPEHWPAWFHLGVLFGEQGHHELAVSMLSRSGDINRNNAVIRNHLADNLLLLDRAEEARKYLDKSWSLDPSHENISAPLKVGKLLWENNQFEEAIEYFNIVINDEEGDDKDSVDRRCVARWFRTLCRMTLGDYKLAWEDYECRNDLPGVIVPRPEGERWQGQSLKGKTIFLAYEQRFGDFIQYLRFLPRLTAMGARVILHTPPELERQVRVSFPDIEIAPIHEEFPEYDYYHYLTSIPCVLNLGKEDIKSDPVKYLDIAKEDKKPRLPMRAGTSLKVGLVWQGKPDPDRSVPLEKYIPLLRHRSVSFYSFQLGERRTDLYQKAISWLVHDLGGNFEDFYESSVLLKEMDLLITIDTAIAHQAGALGMPVWVVLRHFADWRWEAGLENNMWYPTMRLFRQHRRNDWSAVDEQLEPAFAEWVNKSLKKKGK